MTNGGDLGPCNINVTSRGAKNQVNKVSHAGTPKLHDQPLTEPWTPKLG